MGAFIHTPDRKGKTVSVAATFSLFPALSFKPIL